MRSFRGFVLIEILVVVALIAVAAGAYFAWYSPRRAKQLKEAVEAGEPTAVPGAGETVLGQALQKAQSMECANNLSQLRQAIQMSVSDTGAYPASLQDLNMPSLSACPVTGQPYQYDPATGTVKCPAHPQY
jgi:prepilin-type N-terminal cleavage/methylation domain-containing protein